jgi:hypothetical protein
MAMNAIVSQASVMTSQMVSQMASMQDLLFNGIVAPQPAAALLAPLPMLAALAGISTSRRGNG